MTVKSRPLRARELKQYVGVVKIEDDMSRPLRARELKLGSAARRLLRFCRAPCGRVN